MGNVASEGVHDSPYAQTVTPTKGSSSRSEEPVRPRPANAYALARKKYLAGERIDLGQMADELGINRVTLYRWVGTRDGLILEVIWRLTEQTLNQEWQKFIDLQGPRVPALLVGFLRASWSHPGGRHFLMTENERLMRLTTIASNGYQPRFLAAVRYYLSLDIEAGRVSSNIGLDDLAFVCVRIAESYQYRPTIDQSPFDGDVAERVLTALLSGSDHSAAPVGGSMPGMA